LGDMWAGHVVLLKEPVAVASKFRSFSSHIFSQVSQNITVHVKVRVGHRVENRIFMKQIYNIRQHELQQVS
jgi:hypothetical protein